MKRQSIVFVEACNAQLLEEDVPALMPDGIMIKVAVSTISSGTERANYMGTSNLTIRRDTDGIVRYPRKLGYSTSGVIVGVGENVKKFKVGDRVASCWTTHSEYVCISEKNAIKIDDSISFNEAALWHIATFPMAAIRKLRVELGESAIVMGMGILGLMAIKLLHAIGATPVIAVDPIPEKRELALKTGADFAFDPFEPDFGGRVRSAATGGINVAVEVTGNGQALDMVLDCMALKGRVALLGCTRDSNFTIDYYKKVHGPGISLIGAHTNVRPLYESSAGLWTLQDDMKTVQNLVRYKRLEFASLIEEVHSPGEAHEIYKRLAEEKAFPVVQFDFGKLN